MSSTALIPDGFHPSLDEKVYRADPAVSVSDIKEMLYTPAHFYSKKFGGYRPNKSTAQQIGTLVHLLALEPYRWKEETIALPDNAPRKPTSAQLAAKKPSEDTVAAIAWWAEWEKQNGHKMLLSPDEVEQTTNIVAAIYANNDAAQLLNSAIADDGGHVELAVFNTIGNEFGKVRIKGKIDAAPAGDTLADIKTVDRGYANPEDFSKSIEKWNYHMQAAWYLDLYNAVSGADDEFSVVPKKTKWVFIVAEKEPPYAVCTLELDPEAIEVGRSLNRVLLRRFAQCAASNHWPGPVNTRQRVGLTRWTKASVQV